jgi:REP element-mobilizing transposase RayT
MMIRELPKRKPNRLKNYDYSLNGAYFVTLCAKNREAIFGTVVPVGATVLGRPSLVVIQSPTGDRGRSPLHNLIRNIKSYVTKWAGFSPWQKSFHDHIVRDEKDYNRIADYIAGNPAMEGDIMNQIAEREPMIKRAMTVEDIFAQNAREREMYEIREKGRRDYESAITGAKMEGLEEKAQEVAKNLLLLGVSHDIIVKSTGLSLEKIRSLMN